MNVVDTITEMEIRRFEALLKADIGALEILCSEQLVFTLSTGERDDKRTYLEKIESGFFTYHEMVHSTDKVVVVDGVALVFGRMTGATSAGGVRGKVNNVYLVVWGQENGAWKFIAHQPTPLPANEP